MKNENKCLRVTKKNDFWFFSVCARVVTSERASERARN